MFLSLLCLILQITYRNEALQRLQNQQKDYIEEVSGFLRIVDSLEPDTLVYCSVMLNVLLTKLSANFILLIKETEFCCRLQSEKNQFKTLNFNC